MTLRIALLRSDGPHHHYLEELLDRRFNLVCVVEEPAREQRRRLRVRRRWRDWLWRHYHDWRRELFGLNRYRKSYFNISAKSSKSTQFKTNFVENINDASVIERLGQTCPDVVIVIGTSVLSKKILQTGGPFINIHGGLLPFYRGNHCFFFAIYDRRPDLVGSTIHIVDAGVDTGDIIETVSVSVTEADTPETLYCRAEKLAIHRLVDLLSDLESGLTLPRRKQAKAGRTIRTRDRKPYHDLVMFARRALSRFLQGRKLNDRHFEQ